MKKYNPRLRLLTAREAAEVCAVSEACIRQWVTRGYLKPTASYRKTGARLYREDHLLEVERTRRMARNERRKQLPG